MDIRGLLTLVACFFVVSITAVGVAQSCVSPQYLEISKRGTVECPYQGELYGTFWFNSSNYVTNSALIFQKGLQIMGDGYTSGNYDMDQNGSLIINNVSLHDEHIFTVVRMQSLDHELVPKHILVKPIVKPHVPYPVISGCKYNETLCFRRVSKKSEIRCFVQNSRPRVEVIWIIKTKHGLQDISLQKNFSSNGALSTSSVITTDEYIGSSLLNVLTCKAYTPRGMLTSDESLIIVQNDKINPHFSKFLKIELQLYLRSEITCSDSQKYIVVWKHKRNIDNQYKEIVYAAYHYDTLKTTSVEEYSLGPNGSLVIGNVTRDSEGFLRCIYSDGDIIGVVSYEAVIYVLPEPNHPVVEGCDHYRESDCGLEVDFQGQLNCTVRGIFPKVKLKWLIFQGEMKSDDFFYNQESTTEENADGTFDVYLVAHYKLRQYSILRQSVICYVITTNVEALHLSTKVDLLFSANEHNVDSVPRDDTEEYSNGKVWIIAVVVITITALLLVAIGLRVRVKLNKRSGSHGNADYEITLLPNQKKDMKTTLVNELKSKYKDMCATVCPIPFLREEAFSVNGVFVQGASRILIRNDSQAGLDRWETVDSYHDIIRDSFKQSNRFIIEGDPGYGKSTLTLQFAYEWANNVTTSPFRDVEVFLLLRLRQLGHVENIASAIKQFILPRDTSLTEFDITDILKSTKCVVMVLDGFDEYPHRDEAVDFDVLNIIKRKIFQNFKVILTTRSYCLPSEYLANSTRIHLDGFDEKAREAYIQKAIEGSKVVAVEHIQEKLKENPFLEDLLMVPLFFVLFAHLSVLQNPPQLKCVTTFFRFVVSCLHHHHISKLPDENVFGNLYDQRYEEDHSELDKLAFTALCKKPQQISWKKDIISKVGKDFYNQYVQTGILLEEEICYVSDNPSVSQVGHIHRYTEVRFYHKLFCEWYAAHFLSQILANKGSLHSKDDFNNFAEVTGLLETKAEHILEKINPTELHYMFRFACGLNSDSAEKIYEYLKSLHGGERFAILCILEQTEKFGNMVKDLKSLCGTTIRLDREHSELHLNSTVQLLKIASRIEIDITKVMFCNRSVDVVGEFLFVEPNVKIPQLNTLIQLVISEERTRFSARTIENILQFCVKCPKLRSVRFEFCLMPKKVEVNHISYLRRDLKVLWDTDLHQPYKLSLKSGQWEHHGERGFLTVAEYQKEVTNFEEMNRHCAKGFAL